jgi:hypothetical protein
LQWVVSSLPSPVIVQLRMIQHMEEKRGQGVTGLHVECFSLLLVVRGLLFLFLFHFHFLFLFFVALLLLFLFLFSLALSTSPNIYFTSSRSLLLSSPLRGSSSLLPSSFSVPFSTTISSSTNKVQGFISATFTLRVCFQDGEVPSSHPSQQSSLQVSLSFSSSPNFTSLFTSPIILSFTPTLSLPSSSLLFPIEYNKTNHLFLVTQWNSISQGFGYKE